MSNKYIDSLTDWENIEKTLDFTREEWDEIELKVKIAGEIIEARQSQELTQQALETLSSVRQSAIARAY